MNAAPEVTPIPCLKDNYAYLLRCPSTEQTGVVDPSVAQPVLKVLRDRGWDLDYIFNTHHHWDHVGGNEELKQEFPSVRIFGHQSDEGRIPGLTDGVQDGQVIGFGDLNGIVIHNPGHTKGAITYVWGDAAFTGDTLFAAGCGRIFEGSPQDMYSSLHQKIGSLPPETRLYFGHEYTEKNLEFSLDVEPNNHKSDVLLKEVRKIRAEGKFTTPSTISQEFATNPFMRTQELDIQKRVRELEPDADLSPVSVFRVLREYKNRF
ncbi:MAG: hydroxyacylglutathione hydrolase [SAR324 cluster bacterium]|nr:hydroxyacylglutathione hydrolase [SAR324 cluster bacterium]